MERLEFQTSFAIEMNDLPLAVSAIVPTCLHYLQLFAWPSGPHLDAEQLNV